MSNINAENITVTNLTVANINGIPASAFESCICTCPPEDCYECPTEEPPYDDGCYDCYEPPPCPCHSKLGSIGSTGATGSTGAQGPPGLGIYNNDSWLIDNLFGQPPAIKFGTPVYKTTEIIIPWDYIPQTRWTSTQYLPNIQFFTQSIIPSGNTGTSYYVANNSGDTGWIRDNTNSSDLYATILSIQKNSTTNGFSNISYTDALGNGFTGYGYKFYSADLSNELGGNRAANVIKAYYSNVSEIVTTMNEESLTFAGFLSAGNPEKPTGLTLNSPGVTGLGLSWTAPVADTSNPDQGLISSYNIKYAASSNTIRYGGLIGQTGATGSTTNNVSLSGLYPDTSYSIEINATNNSDNTGAYSDPSNFSTSNLTPLAPLSGSLGFTGTRYSPNNYSGAIFTIPVIGGTGTNIGSTPLLKQSNISTSISVPIHLIANRGNLQYTGLTGATGATGPIMTFSTKINSNNECSVSFSGFPATIPNSVTSDYVTIEPQNIVDNYSGNTAHQGFYLNASLNIGGSTGAFIPGSTANNVTCKQTFYDGSTGSANYNFYYETPFSSGPTGSIDYSISSASFKTISGINVLHSTPVINIGATGNNMGDYFYRSPPIAYTCTFGPTGASGSTGPTGKVSTTFSETSLLNAAGYTGGRITNSNLYFNSSITSNSLRDLFAKSVSVSATINNINGTSTTSILTKNAITDDLSNTFVYTTLPQSIQNLVTNTDTKGFRIWSAPSISNNCPNLKYDLVEYFNIPYNNSWNIASDDNSGYDATTELQVYNGSFITRAFNSSNAYINYSPYLQNTNDYSLIASAGNRFASFCWKIPLSSNAYISLSFTINSNVNNQFENVNAGKVQVNDTDLLMFYSIRDTSNSDYNGSNTNTVWINANSNDPPPTSSNYFSSPNGSLGGLISIDNPSNNSTSSSTTFKVFIPSKATSDSTYLYFRLGCPMNTSFSFTTVTASISK